MNVHCSLLLQRHDFCWQSSAARAPNVCERVVDQSGESNYENREVHDNRTTTTCQPYHDSSSDAQTAELHTYLSRCRNLHHSHVCDCRGSVFVVLDVMFRLLGRRRLRKEIANALIVYLQEIRSEGVVPSLLLQHLARLENLRIVVILMTNFSFLCCSWLHPPAIQHAGSCHGLRHSGWTDLP